jgi:hypothetical protein
MPAVESFGGFVNPQEIYPMKRRTRVFVVVGFALASSAALAGQDKPRPMPMNDAQLEAVAAGQLQISDGLVNVTVGDITVQDIPINVLNNSLNDVTVQVPVAANVNAVIAALGNARGLATQYGRQN